MSNHLSSVSHIRKSNDELHDYDEEQITFEKDINTMSNRLTTASDIDEGAGPSQLDVSVSQRMLSAISGSLITSLLGMPLHQR